MLHNVDVHAVVEQTARANDVDPLLVHSVIKAESNYNPIAVSPKGAMGLMQLMPGTARRFGAVNTFDVRQNIEAGVKYLRYLQGMFRNDRLALAAYNAGEGAVLRYGDIPPYRETENYVYKVGKSYGEALKQQRIAPPPPPPNDAVHTEAAPEPLRQLEIARDAEGRIVLRTR
jgi:soluble lytic murein transglycosylase-like protein